MCAMAICGGRCPGGGKCPVMAASFGALFGPPSALRRRRLATPLSSEPEPRFESFMAADVWLATRGRRQIALALHTVVTLSVAT